MSGPFSFALKEWQPVPDNGRCAYEQKIERSENEGLKRVAVLMLKKESSCLTFGAARHKDELAERNGAFLIPGGSGGAFIVEMIFLPVSKIKRCADESLGKSPAPLRRCVRAFLQFSSVRLFHVFMIAHQRACVV